jgi:hypothetical protein
MANVIHITLVVHMSLRTYRNFTLPSLFDDLDHTSCLGPLWLIASRHFCVVANAGEFACLATAKVIDGEIHVREYHHVAPIRT